MCAKRNHIYISIFKFAFVASGAGARCLSFRSSIYIYIYFLSLLYYRKPPRHPLQHLIQIRHSFGILFQDRTNRPSLTAPASLPWPFETTLDRSGILLSQCGSKLGAFDAQSASKPTQNPSKIQSQTSINTPESTIFVFS